MPRMPAPRASDQPYAAARSEASPANAIVLHLTHPRWLPRVVRGELEMIGADPFDPSGPPRAVRPTTTTSARSRAMARRTWPRPSRAVTAPSEPGSAERGLRPWTVTIAAERNQDLGVGAGVEQHPVRLRRARPGRVRRARQAQRDRRAEVAPQPVDEPDPRGLPTRAVGDLACELVLLGRLPLRVQIVEQALPSHGGEPTTSASCAGSFHGRLAWTGLAPPTAVPQQVAPDSDGPRRSRCRPARCRSPMARRSACPRPRTCPASRSSTWCRARRPRRVRPQPGGSARRRRRSCRRPRRRGG